VLLAVACGVAVANLYYAQPVLSTIAHAFGTTAGTAGLVVTCGQIGYAVGLALLVPLGDLLVRRRLVPAVLALTSASLLVAALAGSIWLLMAVLLVAGFGSVVAQMLVPMAASMADDDNRGQVVGSVMTGLLLGILLARTVSGVIASVASWRVVYFTAAGLTLVLAAVLARRLPGEPPRPTLRYRTLLRSTVALFLEQPTLRLRALLGALELAAFSVFWTTVAFLLSGAPYHYGVLTIGLFGLCGAAGALCANFAGRWVDRGLHHHTTLVFSVLIAVAFGVLWFGGHHVGWLIAGILVLDAGAQGIQVTNQSVIYGLAPEARSRVNSSYMVCFFAGGAIGSALASVAYDTDRWAGVCVLGGAIGLMISVIALADAYVALHRRQRDSGGRVRVPATGR
jgi:predicted MFS family arabinose efflux permease